MPVTTPGKILLRKQLPRQVRDFAERTLDKKAVNKLLTRLAKDDDPYTYIKTLQTLNDLGRKVVTEYGRTASLSPEDFVPPPKTRKAAEKLRTRVSEIYEDPKLSTEAKEKRVIALVDANTDRIKNMLLKELKDKNSSFYEQIISGSKAGKDTQLRQLLFGNFNMLDNSGNPVPYPSLEGYSSGVSPTTYWAAAHGGRKGYVDLQAATSDAGYFGKQITSAAHKQVITGKDCKTSRSLIAEGDDEDNVGAILQEKVGPYNAGEIITEDMLPRLRKKQIKIRSPLVCEQKEGLCSKCAGVREKGKLPEVGEYVGVNAVRSFIEPLTQAQISSKHLSGSASDLLKKMSGFKLVDTYFQMPKHSPFKATQAWRDGMVTDIKKAPQGGHYVYIDGEKEHVSEETPVTVKKGQKVEAGDNLSEGITDLKNLVMHKGIGEARRLFVTELRNMLEENNSDTNRRNLEPLARSFIGRIRITDPEGYKGYLPDDITEYQAFSKIWKPRKTSYDTEPKKAVNNYLESPAMHYTIGTRITPSMAKYLKTHGINKIKVNKEPPPFEPYIERVKAYNQIDEDWATALGGENLTRTFKRLAGRGAETNLKGTSYYPKLMNISESM